MAHPRDVESIKLVSQRDLRGLLQQCESYQKKVDNASGHLSELIADYVTKKNLHRGAFRIARRWARMERSELWLELAHLDDYRQKLGIDKLAKQQGQLLGPGMDEDEEQPENVARLPRRVAESAGEAAE